jgi:uncharacterized integral membrane protein (TIGR00698 family)
LTLVAVATAMGFVVGEFVPAASPLVVGIVLGVVWRSVFGQVALVAPGLRFAATWLLRGGVMLLGMQLALGQVVHFGLPVLLVVLVSVVVTFVVTRRLGSFARLGEARSLLVATGVSICGASAVAAANTVADGDEDDVATAVTSVTLLGTLAIAVFPVLALVLDLDDTQFGILTGASVHEVGQVVAIGGAAGAVVLHAAVVIKLARVVLLAPLVMLLGAHRRRAGVSRPPVVPWFVAGFVVLMLIRTTGVVPAPLVSVTSWFASLLLCAGMFGLGAAVDLRAVLRSGGRALVVAATGSVLLVVLVTAGLFLVT